MKNLFVGALILFISGCTSKIQIEGFDQKLWMEEIKDCNDNKMEIARVLIDHQESLLGKGQVEIKSLLGAPAEHELYRRNMKFFYYPLSAGDSCEHIESQQKLSILFDALDRAKEIMILE